MTATTNQTSADPPIIRFEGVHKWFGNFHVLRHIDLDVVSGERIVICGPSGSGKSTLVRCINQLETHQQGRIVVDGTELSDRLADIHLLRSKIGMVFQSYNLFPHMSVLDNLAGGQQQRVAIARALCMKPKIMLFDEVTSSLDPEMVKEVLDVIVDLAGEGMTMMVVTHEMGFAREVADRIVFMEEGCIVEENKPAAFFNRPGSEGGRFFLSQVLHYD